MKPFQQPFIRVNEIRIDLSSKALQEGQLRLDEGAETEQCEGCGEDIIVNAQLCPDQRRVECLECGATYEIIEHQNN